VSPLLALAARLEAVARWLDDGRGAGEPAAYLVDQGVIAIRQIAATARAEAEAGHILPEVDQ
jgi:hypothetical protein